MFKWQKFDYCDPNTEIKHKKLLKLIGARLFPIEEIACYEYRVGKIYFIYSARPLSQSSFSIPIPFLRTDYGFRLGKLRKSERLRK